MVTASGFIGYKSVELCIIVFDFIEQSILRIKRFLLITFLCISAESANSQVSAPKYSNEFLAIGVGASALGMSNAVVSSVSDVTAAYWNPAGLLRIREKYQFSLMHAAYFSGIANFDYGGFATPVDSSSFLAVSVIRFGIDDIPDTRFLYDANGALNYNNIRFFSAADYAFLLSYARNIPALKGLKIGANFKVIHRRVGDFANAWGFGLDLGFQKDFGRWKTGLMIRDITSTFNAWTHNSELVADIYTQTGNIIPTTSIEITLPRAILGVSRRFVIHGKFGVAASLDLDMTFDGKRNVLVRTGLISVSPLAGMEMDYDGLAYLRLGAGEFQKIKNFDGTTRTAWQPNFGIGVRLKYFSVDYALTDIGDQAEALYSHVFSVSVRLDGKKGDKKEQ